MSGTMSLSIVAFGSILGFFGIRNKKGTMVLWHHNAFQIASDR
jgi:hypothetical protein